MEWISVNEQVPGKGERVIAVFDFGGRSEIDVVTWSNDYIGIIKFWSHLPQEPREYDDSVFLMSNGRENND